jgi:archaellum component FlaC
VSENNSVKEKVARHEAQIEMILDKLENIERKLDKLIVNVIHTQNLEEKINYLSNEVNELKNEINRIYTLYRWVIGLVLTALGGFSAVIYTILHGG